MKSIQLASISSALVPAVICIVFVGVALLVFDRGYEDTKNRNGSFVWKAFIVLAIGCIPMGFWIHGCVTTENANVTTVSNAYGVSIAKTGASKPIYDLISDDKTGWVEGKVLDTKTGATRDVKVAVNSAGRFRMFSVAKSPKRANGTSMEVDTVMKTTDASETAVALGHRG